MVLLEGMCNPWWLRKLAEYRLKGHLGDLGRKGTQKAGRRGRRRKKGRKVFLNPSHIPLKTLTALIFPDSVLFPLTVTFPLMPSETLSPPRPLLPTKNLVLHFQHVLLNMENKASSQTFCVVSGPAILPDNGSVSAWGYHCSVRLWTPYVNRAIAKLKRGGLGDRKRSLKTKEHREGFWGPTQEKAKLAEDSRLISGIWISPSGRMSEAVLEDWASIT